MHTSPFTTDDLGTPGAGTLRTPGATQLVPPGAAPVVPDEARRPRRRLVIVVRADPVICGHSVEARNLAEAALTQGFDDVRIVSWDVDHLREIGLPLKPTVEPYSPGIHVERPAPVGGYKIPDARHTTGMVGRLVELFTDGVPTVCMSLYLLPHAMVVAEALTAARATGLPVQVTTIAEAVGSDITDIARAAVEEGRLGVAAHLFTTYLSSDHCVAVSDFTRDLIIEAAEEVDARLGTTFAPQCRTRVAVSYPAIDTSAYTQLDPRATEAALRARGLERDGYALFLSRLTDAKGADDLLRGYAASPVRDEVELVIAGNGPAADGLHALVHELGVGERVQILHDVSDAEKPHLMAGCAAYALPSKPRREFVETFGIALAEVLLAGGGPVITCATGGIPEAVGEHAMLVPPDSPAAIGTALEHAVALGGPEREAWRAGARDHALQFDRAAVLANLLAMVDRTVHLDAVEVA